MKPAQPLMKLDALRYRQLGKSLSCRETSPGLGTHATENHPPFRLRFFPLVGSGTFCILDKDSLVDSTDYRLLS